MSDLARQPCLAVSEMAVNNIFSYVPVPTRAKLFSTKDVPIP
jgi:hypothetical protein